MKRWFKRHVIVTQFGEPYIMLRRGVGFSHAERGGRLCLRGQTSWRTVNGVWINTNWGCLWLLFRRTF